MAKQGRTHIEGGCFWGQLNCDFCKNHFEWKEGRKVFYSPTVFNGDDEVEMEICEDCMGKENLKKDKQIMDYYRKHFKS